MEQSCFKCLCNMLSRINDKDIRKNSMDATSDDKTQMKKDEEWTLRVCKKHRIFLLVQF